MAPRALRRADRGRVRARKPLGLAVSRRLRGRKGGAALAHDPARAVDIGARLAARVPLARAGAVGKPLVRARLWWWTAGAVREASLPSVGALVLECIAWGAAVVIAIILAPPFARPSFGGWLSTMRPSMRWAKPERLCASSLSGWSVAGSGRGAGAFGRLDNDPSVAVPDHRESTSQGGPGGGSAPSRPASSGRQPQRPASACARNTASPACQVCPSPRRTSRYPAS